MKVKNIICFSVFLISFLGNAVNIYGQESVGGLGFSVHQISSFSYSNQELRPVTFYSLSMSGFDTEKAPVEWGVLFSLGFDKEIAWVVGIPIAYVHPLGKYHFLKAGMKIEALLTIEEISSQGGIFGILSTDTYDEAVGALSLTPYIEWEHEATDGFSFFVNFGSRYIDTANLYTERNRSSGTFQFSNNGWELGIGIRFGF